MRNPSTHMPLTYGEFIQPSTPTRQHFSNWLISRRCSIAGASDFLRHNKTHFSFLKFLNYVLPITTVLKILLHLFGVTFCNVHEDNFSQHILTVQDPNCCTMDHNLFSLLKVKCETREWKSLCGWRILVCFQSRPILTICNLNWFDFGVSW